MAADRKISVIPRAVSDKEFERLLRRAAELLKVEQPRLLKRVLPVSGRRAS
jgi:hypothetical protein